MFGKEIVPIQLATRSEESRVSNWGFSLRLSFSFNFCFSGLVAIAISDWDWNFARMRGTIGSEEVV